VEIKKKINEALAVAKIPRVLHPGVLSRTNQVISRTRDFLFLFFSVSRVIKQVDLSSVITKKWRTAINRRRNGFSTNKFK
jgi:hypothetical protein